MKTHFIQLFDYDRFANKTIIDAIISAGAPAPAVRIMAHLLVTQQAWLSRLKDPGFRVTGSVWPEGNVDGLLTIMEENHQAWLQYLEPLVDKDFSVVLNYFSIAGAPFSNQRSDIITHVINHGTHHRAQAGQELKRAGVEKLPATDYIFYFRQ
ncbi:MAG: DinB family protein [Chitinophagaceae bacterium]|nr:DinB family protein [Chitinophagaceae bacterium]